MSVVIYKTRHDECATQVHDAGAFARELAHPIVGAYHRNSIAGNAKSMRERDVALARPDFRVQVHDVERLVRGDELTSGEQRAHAHQHFASIDQITSPGVGVPLMVGASSLACASSSFRNKRAAGESERAA